MVTDSTVTIHEDHIKLRFSCTYPDYICSHAAVQCVTIMYLNKSNNALDEDVSLSLHLNDQSDHMMSLCSLQQPTLFLFP